MKSRKAVLVGICLVTAVAGGLLAISRTRQEVDLESVVEIWADIVRDADRVGLTITRVPARREMEIGREIEEEIARRWRLKDYPRDYVARVGETLLKHTQRRTIGYRFYVVDSSLVNAFAIPGGGIYITTGMLDFLESEAELAAILGHEISHVDLRHCIERHQYELAARKIVGKDLALIARIGYTLVELGFNEQQELEADAGGAMLAGKAGYDPWGGIAVFERLAKVETERKKNERVRQPALMLEELGIALGKALEQYFATHPPTEKRIRELHLVVKRTQEAWRGQNFYIGRSNYTDRISRSGSERASEWRQ